MHRNWVYGFLITLLTCTFSYAATPPLDHIVIVALENKSYSEVVGSPAMPYLNSLMKSYALATDYYANYPGSVPDYFLITTGQAIARTPSVPTPVTANNLVRAIHAAGKTWKAYAQSIPYAGYLGGSVSPYIKYHNPFAYFSDVINNKSQAANIVSLTQFSADVASDTLPDYAFIVPDNRHNAHDCPGTSNCQIADELRAADNFLQTYIPPLLNTASFQESGLLILWWDEGTENGGDEHVAITLVGPQVKKNFRSGVFHTHPSVLRTVAEALQLGSFPGASATAKSLGEFFTTPPDFSVAVTPNSQTVPAGQSASYSITVEPLTDPLTDVPTLACSGQPAEASCTFTPPVPRPDTSDFTSTLTISTTAPVVALESRWRNRWFVAMLLPLLGLAFVRRWRLRMFAASLFVVSLLLLFSCAGAGGAASSATGGNLNSSPGGAVTSPGGTGAAPTGGTPAGGAYNIQVQATTPAFTHAGSVTLVVQ